MSCQSGPDEPVAPEGQCTVTFSVSNYRQISFDDLSSASTRATVTVRLDLANLQITVFNAETNEQVSPTILHKSADYYDEDDKPKALLFPQFSVTLPYGRYRVLVLGYNGSRDCNITSLNHISWAENYVPNTFLSCEEFTLNESSNLNKEITLRHVVAAFRVTTEDVIPTEVKKMRFSSTAGGTVLNAMTGFALQNTGRTSDLTNLDGYIGKPGMFTIYYFLPEEQTTGNFTVQALGQNDVVLYQKHFNNVPLRINYLTEWKGKLFESSDDGGDDDPSSVQNSFSIKWNMDWAGTLTVTP